jgi:hypothetical protein
MYSKTAIAKSRRTTMCKLISFLCFSLEGIPVPDIFLQVERHKKLLIFSHSVAESFVLLRLQLVQKCWFPSFPRMHLARVKFFFVSKGLACYFKSWQSLRGSRVYRYRSRFKFWRQTGIEDLFQRINILSGSWNRNKNCGSDSAKTFRLYCAGILSCHI